MILEVPELLGAELDLGDYLELIIFGAIYFVGPLLQKWLKKVRGGAEAEEPEAWEQEPEPTPSAPPPREVPVAAAPRVDAGVPLKKALAAWRAVAGPLVGRRGTQRLVNAVQTMLPDLGLHEEWEPDDVLRAQRALDGVTGLVVALTAVRAPQQRLLWRSARAILDPLVRAERGSGTDEASALVPVGRELPPASMLLLQLAGLVPLTVPGGRASARRRVQFLEESVRAVLLLDREALGRILDAIWERMKVEAGRDRPGAPAFQRLLAWDGLGPMLLDGVATTLMARGTGPMARIVEGERLAQAHSLRSATLVRAAAPSRLTEADVLHDEAEDLGWHQLASLIDDALDELPLRGTTGPAVRTLITAWGPAEDATTAEVASWLAQGARGGPPTGGHRVPALVALMAWQLAELQVADVELELGRLDDGVTGRLKSALPGAPAAAATVDLRHAPGRGPKGRRAASAPGAPTAEDALLIQIILGPPRARRHPMAPRGQWGRRRSPGDPNPGMVGARGGP